eukprot:scaffold524_cov357-Pavlova_lutheri.AAC.9
MGGVRFHGSAGRPTHPGWVWVEPSREKGWMVRVRSHGPGRHPGVRSKHEVSLAWEGGTDRVSMEKCEWEPGPGPYVLPVHPARDVGFDGVERADVSSPSPHLPPSCFHGNPRRPRMVRPASTPRHRNANGGRLRRRLLPPTVQDVPSAHTACSHDPIRSDPMGRTLLSPTPSRGCDTIGDTRERDARPARWSRSRRNCTSAFRLDRLVEGT